MVWALALQIGCAQDDERGDKEKPPPLKALLVAGGVSHDYEARQAVITRGISQRVNRVIEWRTVFEGGGESAGKIPLFSGSGWAEGYDIVVHDYCFPRVRESEYIEQILNPHRGGIPAVLIHGTLHSFKGTQSNWYEFCGVKSLKHSTEHPLTVKVTTDSNSPLDGIKSWKTPPEQLYLIDKVLPGTRVFAEASARFSDEKHPVIWSHEFGEAKTRVFATSLGDSTESLRSQEYLDFLTRGFLWALSEKGKDLFIEVPPEDNLSGLVVPGASSPFQLAIGGHSLPFRKSIGLSANGNEVNDAASLATDGLVNTTWVADIAGPANWEGQLARKSRVEAVALYWEKEIPSLYQIETSENGIDWSVVVKSDAQEDSMEGVPDLPISVYDLSGRLAKWIRVNIIRGLPEGAVGIREIAVFEQRDQLPSALLSFATPSNAPVLLSAENHEFGFDFRLHPKWKLHGKETLRSGMTPTELFTTGDSEGFLFSDADDQSANVTHFRADGGKILLNQFLDDISASSSVAWDGEWLYVVERNSLRAYRDTNKDHVADEKFEIGEMFYPLDEESPLKVTYSSMKIGADGWLYAKWNSPNPVEVYTEEGKLPFLIPREGYIRVDRDGSGFEIAVGPEVDSFEQSTDYLSKIAQIPGITMHARAAEGTLWFVCENSITDEFELGLLSSDELVTPARLDTLAVDELINELSVSTRTRQNEIQWELMRRKLVDAESLRNLIREAEENSAIQRSALRVLNQVEDRKLAPEILALTKSELTELRAFGFELLGIHREGKNHAALSRITKETEPAVSAAILQAILRSDSNAPGLDRLVLKFVSHEDEILSSAAKSFLIKRENSSICFEFLDDEDQKEHWPAAFSVLSQLYKQSVAEEIVLRLEKTTSPEFRKWGLEALCHLYFKGGEFGREWEGTPIADLMLGVSLEDRRVDRSFLIDQMLAFRIPVKKETLIALGRENLPFEALAVSALEPGSLSPKTESWLREITGDRSRDDGLKLAALAKLLPSLKGDVLRKAFATIAEVSDSSRAIVEDVGLKKSWFANTELESLSSWLCEQYKVGDPTEKALARETLLLIAQNESLPGGQLAEIKASLALSEIPGLEPETKSLSGKTLPEIEEMLTPFSGDASLGEAWFRGHGCSHCHNVDGEGRAVGPDLLYSRTSLSTASLLESIFTPTAKIREEYELEVFEQKNGLRLTGVVLHRGDKEVILRDIAGNEMKVALADVHRSWKKEESMMPALDRGTIEIEELADLIAFLKELRIPDLTQTESR